MSKKAVVLLLVVLVACEPAPSIGVVGYNPPTTLEENCEAESVSEFSECPPVPTQATYQAKGLWTFPNIFSNVPDGAFSRADNAVIRRDGLVETRRGFAPVVNALADASARFRSMADFVGTLVGHDSTNKLSRYSGGAWTTYTGTYTPPDSRRMRFLQSAKSLYFTTTEGVKRLDEVTGEVFDAGVPQATGGSAVRQGFGAHASGTVVLAGGAGNVTVTVGGTAVGPVAFNATDMQTAADVVTALNANATVAALVTATSLGTTITLTAVNAGTAGNAITLTASRTAGSATASGATLTGGTAGAGWFAADSQTAYRFVWGIRNANDRVILGAPSGRVALTNESTETVSNITVTVSVPSWVTTSHFLQVYRADSSATENIPAGDDMNLVYETYPTAANITDNSLVFTDVTPDELKGAPLYSSPNAGIPGSEKFQPPVCVDLAEYKGRMWCARTAQRQRTLITLLSVESASGGLGGGEGLTFTIGGVDETYISDPTEDASNNLFALSTLNSASQNIAATARSLVRVINAASAHFTAQYVSGEYDSPGQIAVEAKELGSGEFTVRSTARSTPWVPAMQGSTNALDTPGCVERVANVVTVQTITPHGFAVGQGVNLVSVGDPTDAAAFPTGAKTVTVVVDEITFRYAEVGADASSVSDAFLFETATPPLPSDNTDAPNGIAFAEYGEPDAVPLGNYMEAGSANYEVQRIITLGATLFIFKEDGIFTLTGDSPETFAIQAFPTPAKVVAPDTVVVLGNSIYALTDQGVMVFTESSARVISRPIDNALALLYASSTAYRATTEAQAFAVAYETEREYHLWIPSSDAATFAGESYIYNYATHAWTRWTTDATTGYVLPSSGIEYLGDPTRGGVLAERKTLTAADYQDATGVAITLDVAWQVRTGGDPSAYKQWQKVTAMYETANVPTTVTLSLSTEVAQATASGSFSTSSLPYVTTYVPVDQSRSQTLTVGVTAAQAQKNLTLRGLAVNYIPSSTKLR